MSFTVNVSSYRQVRTLKAALAWATQFGTLRPKSTGHVSRQTITRVGAHLLYCRAPNALSVHGSGRRRAWTLARVAGEYNTATVVEFVREHCERQTAAQRKSMGLKISLSFAPKGLSCAKITDLEHMVVEAAEFACEVVGRNHYKEENLAFVLGMNYGVKGHHHHGMFRARHGISRQGKPQSRAQFHVHVLLLPTVVDPVSGPPIAAVIGAFRNQIAECLQIEQDKEILLLRTQTDLPIEARQRAAALATAEVFKWEIPNITLAGLKQASAQILAEFQRQLELLNGDELRKRYAKIRGLSAGNLRLTQAARIKEADQLRTTIHRLSEEWLAYMADVTDVTIKTAQFIEAGGGTNSPSVRFFDTPVAKALVVERGDQRERPQAGTLNDLDILFGEVTDMRSVIRIVLLALVSQFGVKYSPHQEVAYDLKWVYELARPE